MNYKLFAQMPRDLAVALATSPALRRYFDEICAIKIWF